jgi:chemotaxis response regulator CheB
MNALLYAMPEIDMVAQAGDAQAALDFCLRSQVELVILEVKPGEHELLARLAEMKALCWGRMVVLIHDEADRQPVEASGADLVMTVGMRAAELKVGIGKMIRPLSGEA